MDNVSALSLRIKELRKTYNLNQQQFAAKINCSPATLSAYENGAKNPSLEIVKRIATTFNVSMDWLCGLTNATESNIDLKTFSDVIRLLYKIDESTPLLIQELGMKDDNGYPFVTCAISFRDMSIDEYLSAWIKYRNLRKIDAIDSDIYMACMEKLYKDSNVCFRTSEDLDKKVLFE